ncbi:MAG: hypothetical protein JWP89_4395 [Schlesneria sp.]|nr:hypothetical protein [Schlesneria sp.]
MIDHLPFEGEDTLLYTAVRVGMVAIEANNPIGRPASLLMPDCSPESYVSRPKCPARAVQKNCKWVAVAGDLSIAQGWHFNHNSVASREVQTLETKAGYGLEQIR